jgi:membrane protein YqaA with SNARE-associated domain
VVVNRKKTILQAVAIMVVIVCVIVLFSYFDPESLVEEIGSTNAYMIAFFAALFGGVSTFTGASYYATIVGFLLGGLDPFLLALAAAPGLTLGDIIFYRFGKAGHDLLPMSIQERLHRLSEKLNKKSPYLVHVFVYIYAGFTPFPGDMLMLGLSFLEYRVKQFILPLFLGNATLVLVIALLTRLGLATF